MQYCNPIGFAKIKINYLVLVVVLPLRDLFIFIFTHNQLEINQSACRNKDCE